MWYNISIKIKERASNRKGEIMNKYLTMGQAVEILKGANARFETYTNDELIRLEIKDKRVEEEFRNWDIKDSYVINLRWHCENTNEEMLEEIKKQLNK